MVLPLPKFTDAMSENEEVSGLHKFEIVQDKFSGPFDVFLHLIDEGNLMVSDVSLTDITSAYLNYIKEADVAFEISADFLLMAAFLIEMKSKLLLPPDPSLQDEETLADLESMLIGHIEEYKHFKKAAEHLKERRDYFSRVFSRDLKAEELPGMNKQIVLSDVSLRDLVVAFQKIWDEVSTRDDVQEIQAEVLTVDARIQEIQALLKGRSEGVRFEDIFIRKTKLEVIVTFLAILELAKQKKVRISQDQQFSAIFIFENQGGTANGYAADGQGPS